MLYLHFLFVEKNYVAFLMLKTLLFGEFICDFKVTHKTDVIVIEVRLLCSVSVSLCKFYLQKQATDCLNASILQAVFLCNPASAFSKSLNVMAAFFPPSIWLFPITVETLLSVDFHFTAKTARLHKLDSRKSVYVPTYFSLQEAGQ